MGIKSGKYPCIYFRDKHSSNFQMLHLSSWGYSTFAAIQLASIHCSLLYRSVSFWVGARQTQNTVSAPPLRTGFAVSPGDLDNFCTSSMSACYFLCLLKLKLEYRSSERVREGELFWSVNLQQGLENVSRASTYKGWVANGCNSSLWPNYPVMDANTEARHALNQRDTLLLASCVDLPADSDGQMGWGNEKDGSFFMCVMVVVVE